MEPVKSTKRKCKRTATTKSVTERAPSCCQLRFLAQEAGSICQCVSNVIGFGVGSIADFGKRKDDGSESCDEVDGSESSDEDDGADEVRHLVLVDKAAFASSAALGKARTKSGVRLAFVASVWDVSRAVGALRNLLSVSLLVSAESSKKSVLKCDSKDGKFVYAALVEMARLAQLRAVYVFGIDESVVPTYLDFKSAEGKDDKDVTVLAAEENWKVAWSSDEGKEITTAQVKHAEIHLFETKPVFAA